MGFVCSIIRIKTSVFTFLTFKKNTYIKIQVQLGFTLTG